MIQDLHLDVKKNPSSFCLKQTSQRGQKLGVVTVGMVAALRNRVVFLQLLAEFGAHFDTVDDTNMTALMLAMSHGSEEAARYLLINHPEHSTFHTWLDYNGNTALHLVSYCQTKAAYLTRLMLEKGYGAALRLCYMTQPICSANRVQKTSWISRVRSFTPLTWAILNKRLDVLETLVTYNPSCLLEDVRHVTHSPLHVTLKHMPDKECMPYIDFLLAHGCDGNAVVCGQTAYEYALQEGGRKLEEGTVFSAIYLKKKLGECFLKAECSLGRSGHQFGEYFLKAECSLEEYFFKEYFLKAERSLGRSGHQEVRALKNMCMERVRQLVRATKGRYYKDVSSLPLPPSVTRSLLFEG